MVEPPERLAGFIGRQLRARRLERSQRQEDIAGELEELGIPVGREGVTAIELGRTPPRLAETALICLAYGTSIVEVLSNEPYAMLDLGTRVMSAGLLVALMTGDTAQQPAVNSEALHRIAAGPTEAERRMAKRLRVSPAQIVFAGEKLWGRRLDPERDARTPPGSPGEQRAHRGHITRELQQELVEQLERQ